MLRVSVNLAKNPLLDSSHLDSVCVSQRSQICHYVIINLLFKMPRLKTGKWQIYLLIFFPTPKELCKEFENQVRSGRLFCTRESDPIRGPDGKMHGNKCALCADILWVYQLLLSSPGKWRSRLMDEWQQLGVRLFATVMCLNRDWYPPKTISPSGKWYVSISEYKLIPLSS